MATLTQAEEDELLRLLDRAIYSDNPTVKKALRNLMLVTALCETSETDEHEQTLFSSLRKEQYSQRREVEILRKTVADLQHRISPAYSYNDAYDSRFQSVINTLKSRVVDPTSAAGSGKINKYLKGIP